MASLYLAVSGCALPLEERELASRYAWTQRGRVLGRLALDFCRNASARERLDMLDGIDTAAGPVRVTLRCPPEWLWPTR